MVYGWYALGTGMTLLQSEKMSTGSQTHDLDFSYNDYDHIRILAHLLPSRASGGTTITTPYFQIQDSSANVLSQYVGRTQLATSGNSYVASTTQFDMGSIRVEITPDETDYVNILIDLWKSQETNQTWIAMGQKLNTGNTPTLINLWSARIDASVYVPERILFDTGDATVLWTNFTEFYIFGQSY